MTYISRGKNSYKSYDCQHETRKFCWNFAFKGLLFTFYVAMVSALDWLALFTLIFYKL